jgi:hypothetical protein
MSRSAEDWQDLTMHAASIRADFRAARERLEEWPAHSPDIAEGSRVQLEKLIDEAEAICHKIVGATFVDWAWE